MPWVARDLDGELGIFRVKPQRIRCGWFSPGHRDCITWWKPNFGWPDPYPELKWEDAPVKVEISVEEASRVHARAVS